MEQASVIEPLVPELEHTGREAPAAFGRAQGELYTVILGKPL